MECKQSVTKLFSRIVGAFVARPWRRTSDANHSLHRTGRCWPGAASASRETVQVVTIGGRGELPWLPRYVHGHALQTALRGNPTTRISCVIFVIVDSLVEVEPRSQNPTCPWYQRPARGHEIYGALCALPCHPQSRASSDRESSVACCIGKALHGTQPLRSPRDPADANGDGHDTTKGPARFVTARLSIRRG